MERPKRSTRNQNPVYTQKLHFVSADPYTDRFSKINPAPSIPHSVSVGNRKRMLPSKIATEGNASNPRRKRGRKTKAKAKPTKQLLKVTKTLKEMADEFQNEMDASNDRFSNDITDPLVEPIRMLPDSMEGSIIPVRVVFQGAAAEPLAPEGVVPDHDPILLEGPGDDPLLLEGPDDDPLLLEGPDDDPLLLEGPDHGPMLPEGPDDDLMLLEGPGDDPLLPEGFPDDVPLLPEGFPDNVPLLPEGFPDDVPLLPEGFPDNVPLLPEGFPDHGPMLPEGPGDDPLLPVGDPDDDSMQLEGTVNPFQLERVAGPSRGAVGEDPLIPNFVFGAARPSVIVRNIRPAFSPENSPEDYRRIEVPTSSPSTPSEEEVSDQSNETEQSMFWYCPIKIDDDDDEQLHIKKEKKPHKVKIVPEIFKYYEMLEAQQQNDGNE